MSTIGSLTRCVYDLRSPDQDLRNVAARIIWERFSPRLKNLVRRHLDGRIARREDEQDVLQNMFASFCQGQREGKTAPASREELWKLLVRITMCKVVNTANRHRAIRRDVRREQADPRVNGAGSDFRNWMLEQVDRSQPTPEERIIVAEEVQRLLDKLSEPLRRIVIWKLEGYTNGEIAAMLGRTVRLVELKLQRIRLELKDGLGLIDDRFLDGKPGSSASDPPVD